MRSAYGFEIPSEDVELTHVGPGTPGGEFMRRYWQPVCASEDLKDLPKRIRILGEELVAFRDGEGHPGLLLFRCSHRGHLPRVWPCGATRSTVLLPRLALRCGRKPLGYALGGFGESL